MLNLIRRKSIIIMMVVSLVGSLLVGSVLAQRNYGAEGAKSVEDYSLEDMLTYAIQDEYLARAEYEAIMNEYGEQRPFSNIIQAEETHIEELLPLFEEHGIEVPQDNAREHVVVPESVEEAFTTGVKAEEDNINMYEKFLQKDIPEDVAEVFAQLKKGSENHLAAFQRGLKRGTENTGRGNGYGRNSQGMRRGQKRRGNRQFNSQNSQRNFKRGYKNQNDNNQNCNCDC